MDDETKAVWVELGERLHTLCAEKFFDVMRGVREVVEAQEILRRFDWQLMFRGRPRKTYHA